LKDLHFKYPLFKENKNMKYVTQKDVKHSLLLATNPQKNPADTKKIWLTPNALNGPLHGAVRCAQ